MPRHQLDPESPTDHGTVLDHPPGGRVTVGPEGRLSPIGPVDDALAAAVGTAIRDAVADGAREITVDVRGCRGGPRLLPVLAGARRALAAGGCTVRLTGAGSEEFLPALDMLPLEEVFLVHEAVRDDARRSGRRRPVGPFPHELPFQRSR